MLAELADIAARLTAAFPAAFPAASQAIGSITFQNNVEPDGMPFHLHVQVVPRSMAMASRCLTRK